MRNPKDKIYAKTNLNSRSSQQFVLHINNVLIKALFTQHFINYCDKIASYIIRIIDKIRSTYFRERIICAVHKSEKLLFCDYGIRKSVHKAIVLVLCFQVVLFS